MSEIIQIVYVVSETEVKSFRVRPFRIAFKKPDNPVEDTDNVEQWFLLGHDVTDSKFSEFKLSKITRMFEDFSLNESVDYWWHVDMESGKIEKNRTPSPCEGSPVEWKRTADGKHACSWYHGGKRHGLFVTWFSWCEEGFEEREVVIQWKTISFKNPRMMLEEVRKSMWVDKVRKNRVDEKIQHLAEAEKLLREEIGDPENG